MENVEIKEEENVQERKKEEKIKKEKKDDGKVKFMESRNEARKKAGLKPAYSKKQIEAYK